MAESSTDPPWTGDPKIDRGLPTPAPIPSPASSTPIGKRIAVGLRLAQMLFIAIFILGVALMIGEGSSAAKLPFSSISISTTIFGLAGAGISELQARRAENWT